jgi:hypothetical protein
MIVTVDGERLRQDLPRDATMQGVIDRVRAALPPDQLIVGVSRNGSDLCDAELAEHLPARLAEHEQVDLVTSDRYRVVAEALRDIGAHLEKVGGAQPELAGRLSTGDTVEAINQFSEFVRTWQACQQALIEGSALVGADLTQLTFDGRAVGQFVDELRDKLRELRDALEARDLVLLADMMHFELGPLCQTWRGLLEHIADAVEARRG